MEHFLKINEFHDLHPLNGKKPSYPNWPDIESTARDIRHWISQGFQSFGLITEKLAVVDCDDKETGRAFFRAYRKQIRTIIQSPRGAHFYFRNDGSITNRQHVEYRGLTYDIRGIGGYVVAPGSVVASHEYRFVDGFGEIDPTKLEPFDACWSPPAGSPSITRGQINDVRNYVMKIESVSGEYGSRGLVRAASVCRDNGLTESEATVLMLEWNQQRAQPPWSEHELTRAISRTYGAKS